MIGQQVLSMLKASIAGKELGCIRKIRENHHKLLPTYLTAVCELQEETDFLFIECEWRLEQWL